MTRLIARVHLWGIPGLHCVWMEGNRLIAVGPDAEIRAAAPMSAVVADGAGALVTPAFHDGHAHVLETGFALTGVSLAGVRSTSELLDAIAAASGEGWVRAHGWDESTWYTPELPTPEELTRASRGRPVYAARVDVHSALVTDDVRAQAGLPVTGSALVATEAHVAARAVARETTPAEASAMRAAALDAAVRSGIVSLEDHAGPSLDSLDAVMALAEQALDPASGMPGLLPWWGELVDTPERARALWSEAPYLIGIGGDLNVDGSLGSHTARLSSPYADAGDSHGHAYLDAEQIARHIGAVIVGTPAQASFHAIGDEATELIVQALDILELEGINVPHGRLRIEHLSLASAATLDAFARVGAVASVQPAFVAKWGGPGGVYEDRLGAERAAEVGLLGELTQRGIRLVFGSDSPVTPFDPWGGIAAAMRHPTPRGRVTFSQAFAASCWSTLEAGQPANLALWDMPDAVAGDPTALPEALASGEVPTWRATFRSGGLLAAR